MRGAFRGGGVNGRGGDGMLRSVQRALRAGGVGAPPEPTSPSTTANSRNAEIPDEHQPAPPNAALTLSSFSTLINPPESVASGGGATAWGSGGDGEMEWEYVEGINDILGTVPSRDEVNSAISDLQQVFGPEKLTKDTYENVENEEDAESKELENISSSSESEVDWIEPSLNLHSSRMLQPYGSNRVYDVFHLLHTEPSMKEMVIAVSCDKAVWNAVSNNEVVKRLRGSMIRGFFQVLKKCYYKKRIADDEQEDNNTDKDSDDNNPVEGIMSWVFVNTKAKIMQLIDKISEIVNEIFQSRTEKKDGKVDPLQEKLKTSLFLSIIVLLVVVVTRARSA